MAENKESKKLRGVNLTSKFWKVFLVVVAAFLTFIGPTYMAYVLANIVEISYAVSMVAGLVLLIAGLVLWWYLVKNKAIF